MKAVEIEIPIFTFIDSRLWNDHELYEKNKSKPILKDIEFPSIDKPETAEFIFEFINFLRHRTKGNSINAFAKFEDIESTLKKQWSGLFQRLLNESRNKQLEMKRIDVLSNQFEDLKTAILTSIGNTNEREVARGVVRYRRLIDFLKNLKLPDYSSVLNHNTNWSDFLKNDIGIEETIELDNYSPSSNRNFRYRTLLIKNDKTFYGVRFGREFLNDLGIEFDAFSNLPQETKNIIFDALADMKGGFMTVRYYNEDFRGFLEKYQREYIIDNKLFEDEENEGN